VTAGDVVQWFVIWLLGLFVLAVRGR